MSFDKDYDNRKDIRRKNYYDSRNFDRTCRSHGSCDYCNDNRQRKNRQRDEISKEKLREWLDEDE